MGSGVPPSLAGTDDLALALVAASNELMLLLDEDLNVIAASRSFCRAFHIHPATVAGRPLAAIGAGEWAVPQLASLLRVAGSGFADIRDHAMDLDRGGQGVRRLVMNAARLPLSDKRTVRIVLTVRDVTDARIAENTKTALSGEQRILLKEVHHRVANSLQIIASLLMQSARKVQSDESRSHLFDAHQRVMSVASLQHQLASAKLGDVELRPYLTTLCENIATAMIRDQNQLSLEVIADECITTADASTGLGLIVTELVIDAIKHAFPDDRSGKILVRYHARGPDWTLSVADDGVGMPARPGNGKAGLSTSIVRALAQQLGAIIATESASPGTIISIKHKQTQTTDRAPDTREKTAMGLTGRNR